MAGSLGSLRAVALMFRAGETTRSDAMGWWQVNADTLAGSRFVVSPLAEATAALMTLERGERRAPGRARLARRPSARLPGAAGRRPGHRAARPGRAGPHLDRGLPHPDPAGEGEPSFEEELARIRRDLRPNRPRRPARSPSARPAPGRAAPRRSAGARRRPAGVGVDGDRAALLAAAPADHRGRCRRAYRPAEPGRLGGGAGRHAAGDALARRTAGCRSTRTTTRRARSPARSCSSSPSPRATAGSPGTRRTGYAVVYPARARLADHRPGAGARDALGALLGPARAGVLVLLDTPKSTTQLVALTGQGLGSVGRHLKRPAATPAWSGGDGPGGRCSTTGRRRARCWWRRSEPPSPRTSTATNIPGTHVVQ